MNININFNVTLILKGVFEYAPVLQDQRNSIYFVFWSNLFGVLNNRYRFTSPIGIDKENSGYTDRSYYCNRKMFKQYI